MDLILWRHAEAADPREGLDDLDRPLTGKGERQAQRMAQWLDQHLPATTRILVSPALRTQQTARALHRKFKTLPALAPDASAQAVIEVAGWPAAREPVLVVGHQPTLGQVAAQLVGGAGAAWRMKKGAVWWLRQREGEDGATVIAVRSPDMG